jgi:hypothetical protein
VKVLAIDPGSVESGWLVLSAPPPARPERFGISPNAELRGELQVGACDLVAIESVPAVYGRSALPALCDAIRWEGRFLERAELAGLRVLLVERARAKALLCRAANADDKDVRAELVRLWGGEERAFGAKASGKGKTRGPAVPGPLSGVTSHVWAALAVAMYAASELEKERHPLLTVGAPSLSEPLPERAAIVEGVLVK